MVLKKWRFFVPSVEIVMFCHLIIDVVPSELRCNGHLWAMTGEYDQYNREIVDQMGLGEIVALMVKVKNEEVMKVMFLVHQILWLSLTELEAKGQ